MGLDSAKEEAGAKQAAVSCKPVASQVPQKRFRGVTKHRRSGRSVSLRLSCFLNDVQHAFPVVHFTAFHSMQILAKWLEAIALHHPQLVTKPVC